MIATEKKPVGRKKQQRKGFGQWSKRSPDPKTIAQNRKVGMTRIIKINIVESAEELLE
ncbi:hypothetical protein [Limnospira platensis]|uniref:hypothetical protein n=1 Tax=Limnospira platensis TaxID=118562 RepID=UPI003D6DAD52